MNHVCQICYSALIKGQLLVYIPQLSIPDIVASISEESVTYLFHLSQEGVVVGLISLKSLMLPQGGAVVEEHQGGAKELLEHVHVCLAFLADEAVVAMETQRINNIYNIYKLI